MIITGIGSRETPGYILREMEETGRQLAKRNHWVRSGHADGADVAFETGAGTHCLVYLPWRGFNSNIPLRGHSAVIEDSDSTHERRIELVRELHPNPDALTRGAWKLMERNTCQVLGLMLDVPSDYVICWTKDGGPTGGTGIAIRLAEREQIPVLNMFHNKWNTAEKVIEWIKNN